MKVIGIPILEKYASKHADVRTTLGAWLEEVEAALWNTPDDIKQRYSTVSFLPNNLVIFNIKGNSHRLVVKVAYKVGVVKVEKVGTHSEYSKWYL